MATNAEVSWAEAVLSAINAPATQTNIDTLLGWIDQEGDFGVGPGQHNNPLNTTLTEPGSTDFAGLPVQSYPTEQEGIQATAATLQGYPDIIADLQSGNGIGSNASAELAEWSGGGYSSITPTSNDTGGVMEGASSTGSGNISTTAATGNTVDPTTALNEMGTLFHGAAEGLDFFFWLWEPGQGWRLVFLVGGIGSGVFAAKLYTSPSVSREKSAAFPAAILFTGISLLFLYMTFRSWPVSESGGPVRPAAYMVEILKGEAPAAGPSKQDNTDAIQAGLEAIASIWVVNKVANSISGLAGAAGLFAGIWAGIKSIFGGGGTGSGGEEIPDIPDVSLTIPNPAGTTATTQLV